MRHMKRSVPLSDAEAEASGFLSTGIRNFRCGVGVVLLVTSLTLIGCEGMDKKPIDEPLTADDAFDASDRSQRDADALLRERRDELMR